MFQAVEDVSIVGPAGELDPHEGQRLLEKMNRFLRYRRTKIVLDLREVDHVHYRFLLGLLSLSTAFSLVSGGIKLANVNTATRQILRFMGVEGFFETYDSVAEAILSFQNPWTRSCRMQ